MNSDGVNHHYKGKEESREHLHISMETGCARSIAHHKLLKGYLSITINIKGIHYALGKVFNKLHFHL